MPGDTPFDAALAALDVEVNINAHRQVTTYDILGLDAVRAAHRAEVDALRDKLTRVLGAIQRLQPTGSPIPGDEVVLAEWIVGEAISARAAHRAEVERAVAEERDRNLDVLADFYSKTRAGRYASLSKEARQARLDVLTHAYSRMGGGLIHERADELDRDEPIDGAAIRARGAKS